jgi:hypothetical protein
MGSTASSFKYTVLTTIASLAAMVLYLMPLHAFLTVWLSSIFGHYTAWRLWKEVLLAVMAAGSIYLLLTDGKIRSHTLTRRLVWLITAYGGLQLLWGVVAYHAHDVGLKALAYGWLIDLRFLVFFLATWTIALRTNRLRAQWQQFVLWPAIVVVVFGLLEAFVLPHNFLQHFGYGPNTILPYETINHNTAYIRIMSTLRGANPLGTYLIIPISFVLVQIVRGKRSWPWWTMLVGLFMVLYMSFSRSAWVGALLSTITICGLALPKTIYRKSQIWVGASIVLLALVGTAIGLRHNVRFQNVIFHTQQHSAVATTSDGGHASALKMGLHDLLHQPLGKGPGSAGPASVYNTHPPRIAENYYVQVGQEVGLPGMAVFIVIIVGVGYLLWLRRSDQLAMVLLASFIGISFVNVLAHAWADDTLAYVWWGLAGIAMAPITPPKTEAGD